MPIQKLKSNICYILDNGAHTAKFGTNAFKTPDVIPNCIMKVKSERRRPFIGDQIYECRDLSGLYYMLPFQKGYILNWDVQKTVWDYIFSKEIYNVKLNKHPICITEPVYNFPSEQEAMNEIFFEEYDSCGLLRLSAPDLAAFHYRVKTNKDTMIVVDTGYSFTHIVPYIDGKKYKPGIKRVDVGGKLLTNHLKEIISYKQLHVMDETHVINQMKEDTCFVSLDFNADMAICEKQNKSIIAREYILPDYSKIRRGYMRVPPHILSSNPTLSEDKSAELLHDSTILDSELQIIRMNNERFTIPEILFNPSDIGVQQKGIPEAIAECIAACPEDSIYTLLANVVITGGNACFSNFSQRLRAELRKLFHTYIDISVHSPADSITYAWTGGKEMASLNKFGNFCVTKEEYEENGHSYTHSIFKSFTL